MGASNGDTFGYVAYFQIRADVDQTSSLGAPIYSFVEPFQYEYSVGSKTITTAEFSINLTDIGPFFYSPAAEYGLADSLGESINLQADISLNSFGPDILGTGDFFVVKPLNRFGFRTEVGLLRGFQPPQDPDVTVSGLPVPRTIDNLKVWFDATDSDRITVPSSIESWSSVVGNVTFTQTTESNRPSVETFNGMDMIRFERSNAEFLTATLTFPITDEFTIFTVENLLNDTNQMTGFMLSDTSSNFYTVYPRGDSGDVLSYWRQGGFAGAANSTVFSTGVNFIQTVVESGTDGYVQYNDGAKGIGTIDAVFGVQDTLTFGKSQFVGGLEYFGRLGEMIIYDRALTDSEVAEVKQYLTDKWL